MIKLSDIEKQNIENAIKHLEKTTSGEVVVYVAKQSHKYLKGMWIAVAVGAIASLVIISILSWMWLLNSNFGASQTTMITLFAMFAAACITYFIPRLRLWFVNDEDLDEEVLQKAQTVFLAEEVFNTKQRTGILIFISQLEHKVIVLGDKGINEKITQEDWESILNTVIEGIKQKNMAPKLIEAIGLCEKLLLDNGFTIQNNDINELANHVRVEE